MQCPMQNNEATGFLLDYCDRKLDAANAALVEKHLQICGSCRELVEAQSAVYKSLQAWSAIDASPDFNRRLYARIEAEKRKSGILRLAAMLAERWSLLPRRRVAAFVAVCALLLAAIWIHAPLNSQNGEQEPQAKARPVDVEQVERTLQDLDMLHQLNPTFAPEANSAGSI